MGTFQGEGKIVAGGDKNEVFSGSVAHQNITAVTADTITAVTASDNPIKVLGIVATGTATSRIRLYSAANTITPFLDVTPAAPLVFPITPNRNAPWAETETDEALKVEIAGGNMVGNYVAVKLITSE